MNNYNRLSLHAVDLLTSKQEMRKEEQEGKEDYIENGFQFRGLKFNQLSKSEKDTILNYC